MVWIHYGLKVAIFSSILIHFFKAIFNILISSHCILQNLNLIKGSQCENRIYLEIFILKSG